jgi:pimeloyl-ACP methyl ester carboxylesterase
MTELSTAGQAQTIRVPVAGRELVMRTWGTGPRLLLCLHGYGMRGADFGRVFPEAPAGWRIVAADLAFFGESKWSGLVSKEVLRELGNALCRQMGVDELHLLGFSLGARWALSLSSFGEVPVRRCVLISPDGLKVHPVYWMATGNAPGRWLFRSLMRHPWPLFLVARILYKLRLLPAANWRLMQAHLGVADQRQQVLDVWLGYAALRPHLPSLVRNTADWNTAWHVIWGRKDRTTPPRLGRRFLRRIPSARRYLIDGGHFLLHPPSRELKDILHSILKDE